MSFIEYERISLMLNRCETIEIYCALKRDVERTIDTHWKHHKHCWPKDEHKLELMKVMAPYAGYDFGYDLVELTKRLETGASP